MKALTLDSKGYNFIGQVMTETGIFANNSKTVTVAFAKSHGWTAKDVKKGYNRFFYFYFVGQMQGDAKGDTVVRILRTDGTWLDFPFYSEE